MNVNLRNIALKTFWTAVSVALGGLLAWVTEADPAWAGVAAVVINAISAWVRERLGETTPTLN